MEIRFLGLRTANLFDTLNFYRQLGVPCLAFGEDYGLFQVGDTQLMFQEIEDPDDGRPSYHFALDIPQNQLKRAAAWLSERVDLLGRDGETEIVHKAWNATSLYFHDPSGNLVELIARHNLENDRDGLFSSDSFLRISEIGWPCLMGYPDREFELPLWFEKGKFKAFGSETGLILVVDTLHPWTPTNEPAKGFPCSIVIHDEKRGSRHFYRC